MISCDCDEPYYVQVMGQDILALLVHIASLEATITNLRTPPSPALIPELLDELREIGADRWTDSITPRIARILFAHIATLEARTEAMAAARGLAGHQVTARYGGGNLVVLAYEQWEAVDKALAALDAQAGEVTG